MLNEFIREIEELYKIINENIDARLKKLAIEKYQKKLHITNEKFSDIYYKFIKSIKEKGVVYTPLPIAHYIIKNTIKAEDIIKNPFLKILDPASGAGNLIIPCYIYLKELYIHNLNEINYKNNLNLNCETINEHIIKNNLYGLDIDSNALKVLCVDLFQLSGYICVDNFVNSDFLIDENSNKFDVVISNPPYVGQKAINRDYSLSLKKLYKDIYKDKGDISYCFFQKALTAVNYAGKLSFITSRYFLEAPSGEQLRKILKYYCSIEKIVDFYGVRPFKNIGVDPVIIFLKKEQIENTNIEIIKPQNIKGSNKKLFYNHLFLNEGKTYNKFYINKDKLSNHGWILRDEKERNIINKIEEHSFTSLANICNSYQGIITGCDAAFILGEEEIIKNNIEGDLIRPWIKSSHISKNEVRQSQKYIIYSDLIKDEGKYINAIQYIKKYKERLMERRECKKGIRKWYGLQWGRDSDIFEGTKIIYPYKAESNRFAIDTGSYFSADVYAIKLKDNVPFSYEYLIFLLNSRIYEFYFKTFAKKLGEKAYEYYPNNLMKLCIPTMDENFTEDYLYNKFELTNEEIEIIKNQID